MALLHSVLIVEDDEDDRLFWKEVIDQSLTPCQLIFAHDGLQALEILETLSKPPVFILTDLNMPRMNGLELIVHLRASDQWRHTPIIAITTANTLEVTQQAYYNGVNSIIAKPMSMDRLKQIWEEIYQQWIIQAKPFNSKDCLIRK